MERRVPIYLTSTTAFGAVSLIVLSAFQKAIIGAPVFNLVGYLVPSLFGGGTGFVYGYFSLGRKRRIDSLERESEIRQLISAVNHALVGSSDVDKLVPEIANIVANSVLFECTFVYLFASTEFDTICIRNTDHTKDQVENFHTPKYIDSVTEEGALRLRDVTEPPFDLHRETRPSHQGVGISISHEGEEYGILTVHFPPDIEPSEDEIELLETIGSDIGYFLHTEILESERNVLAEIVERIDDPIMLQDRDGGYRVVNEAVSEFAGMERDRLKGKDETAFMDNQTARRIQGVKQRVIENEEPISYQVTPTFADGRKRTFSTTRYPYYDSAGELDGSIAICRDITDLKEHQHQIQVMDRVLRHNINNNMNVIQGYAGIIQKEAGDEVAEYASTITTHSGQLLDIAQKQRKITEFLSESHSKEVIDLSTTLERLITDIQTQHPTAQISATIPDGVEVWAINSVELAIMELLKNSIIHSERTTPHPNVKVEGDANTVRIQVIDENQPIPDMDRDILAGEENLGSVRHGSGLGLWLVKLIGDYADGTVSYRENEPRGNIVTVELIKG